MKAQRSESHWEWHQVQAEGEVCTEFESLSQNGASAVSLMLISVLMEMRKKSSRRQPGITVETCVTQRSYVALGQSHTFSKASFFSPVIWGKITCVTRWCPGWDKMPFLNTFQSQKCQGKTWLCVGVAGLLLCHFSQRESPAQWPLALVS